VRKKVEFQYRRKKYGITYDLYEAGWAKSDQIAQLFTMQMLDKDEQQMIGDTERDGGALERLSHHSQPSCSKTVAETAENNTASCSHEWCKHGELIETYFKTLSRENGENNE